MMIIAQMLRKVILPLKSARTLVYFAMRTGVPLAIAPMQKRMTPVYIQSRKSLLATLCAALICRMVGKRDVLVQFSWSIKYSTAIMASRKCVYVLNMLEKVGSKMRREDAVVTAEALMTSVISVHHEARIIVVILMALRAGKWLACIAACGGNTRANGPISSKVRHCQCIQDTYLVTVCDVACDGVPSTRPTTTAGGLVVRVERSSLVRCRSMGTLGASDLRGCKSSSTISESMDNCISWLSHVVQSVNWSSCSMKG